MILYADDFFVYMTVLNQKTGLCFNILRLELGDVLMLSGICSLPLVLEGK